MPSIRTRTENVEIRFNNGLNEEAGQDVLQPPFLRRVINADFDKMGSVHHRNFMVAADTASLDSLDDFALFTYRGALGAVSAKNIAFYEQNAGQFRTLDRTQVVTRVHNDTDEQGGTPVIDRFVKRTGQTGGFFGTREVEVLGSGPASSEEWQVAESPNGYRFYFWNEVGGDPLPLTYYMMKGPDGETVIPPTEWTDSLSSPTNQNINGFMLKVSWTDAGFFATCISREAYSGLQGDGTTFFDRWSDLYNNQGDLLGLLITEDRSLTAFRNIYITRPVAHYDVVIDQGQAYFAIQEQVREIFTTSVNVWGDHIILRHDLSLGTSTSSVAVDGTGTSSVGSGLSEYHLAPTLACGIGLINGQLIVCGHSWQHGLVILSKYDTSTLGNISRQVLLERTGFITATGLATPTYTGLAAFTDDASAIPSTLLLKANNPAHTFQLFNRMSLVDVFDDGQGNSWVSWTGVAGPDVDNTALFLESRPYQVVCIRFDEAAIAGTSFTQDISVSGDEPLYFHSSAQVGKAFARNGSVIVPCCIGGTGPYGFFVSDPPAIRIDFEDFDPTTAFFLDDPIYALAGASGGSLQSRTARFMPGYLNLGKGAIIQPGGYLLTLTDDNGRTDILNSGRFFTDEVIPGPAFSLKNVSSRNDAFTFACDVLQDLRNATDDSEVSLYGKALTLQYGQIPPTPFVEVQDKTVFSTGKNTFWDGVRVNDLTPLTAPIGQSRGVPAGTVPDVQLVWAYTDSKGRRHRSAPYQSVDVRKQLEGGENAEYLIELYQPPPMFAALDASLQLEVYGNMFEIQDSVPPAPLDSNFYLWSTINYEREAAGRFYQTSDGTITIILRLADVAKPVLIENSVPTSPQIYTNGGIQTRDAVPNLVSIVKAGRRLWGVSTDNPERLYYSGIIDDLNQITWNNTNFVTNPGRAIVALASVDEQVIAFSAEGIARVVGQGPNNLGQGPGFILQDIVTDTGCTNAAGVVTTDAGVYFPGRRGIYLLSRGNDSPQFVGGPAEDTLETDRIRQAVVHEKKQVVIWAMDNSVWVVFHYKQGIWGTWSGSDIRTPRSMVVWQDLLVYLDDQNDLYIEDPSQFARRLTLETAEIQLTGIRGFRRLKELVVHGRTTGIPTAFDFVSVSLAKGYETSFLDTSSLSGATLPTAGRFGKRHKPRFQKSETHRVLIQTDTFDNNTDFFISGMTLAVMSKGTEQKKSRTSS
jgi:hypothetical protein